MEDSQAWSYQCIFYSQLDVLLLSVTTKETIAFLEIFLAPQNWEQLTKLHISSFTYVNLSSYSSFFFQSWSFMKLNKLAQLLGSFSWICLQITYYRKKSYNSENTLGFLFPKFQISNIGFVWDDGFSYRIAGYWIIYRGYKLISDFHIVSETLQNDILGDV